MRQELEVLQSIFPELELAPPTPTSESGHYDIQVSFDEPKLCVFQSLPPFEILYLPPLRITFDLPSDYPEVAPCLSLECTWLRPEKLKSLVDEVKDLWQPGADSLYLIFDSLQELATDISNSQFQHDSRFDDKLYTVVSSHNSHALQMAFNEKSYDCEICLDYQPGQDCVGLPCGHIFCKPCLADMCKLHIKEGSVGAILCPSCPKAKTTSGNEYRRIPILVLQQVVSGEEVIRYTKLLRKQEIEALPNTTHCPRDFCATALPRDPDEKLVVCTACDYAFCADCKKTWHGPSEPCRRLALSPALAEEYLSYLQDETMKKQQNAMERFYGKKNLERLLLNFEDEKLADKWRTENAQMCPVCRNFVEKSMGCNHMICSVCNNHFCFLCGDPLSSRNPYSHYSDKGLSCHGRLFEGLTGLEDDFAAF